MYTYPPCISESLNRRLLFPTNFLCFLFLFLEGEELESGSELDSESELGPRLLDSVLFVYVYVLSILPYVQILKIKISKCISIIPNVQVF